MRPLVAHCLGGRCSSTEKELTWVSLTCSEQHRSESTWNVTEWAPNDVIVTTFQSI